MNNYIGLNINYLCSSFKMKKLQFCEVFDIKQSTLSSYTGGISIPPLDVIQRICAHFKISLDDFINVDMQQKIHTDPPAVLHQVAEPTSAYALTTDKIIKAQEKTIATLEKQITLLEKTVDSLEIKLAQKAS